MGGGPGGRSGKASSALPENQLSSGRAPINAPSSRVPSSVQENKLGHNNKKLNNSTKKRCVDHLASDQCAVCPCRRPSTSSASSSSSSPSSWPSPMWSSTHSS